MGTITKILYYTVFVCSSFCRGDNPFEIFQKSAMQSNPVREAEHRVGYGSNSIQPYYLCDKEDSGSAMPISAWHYSCKQACKEDNKRTHVTITKSRWNFIGKSVSVYKVTANKVCYTSHENIWGYCTQTQSIEPTTVTDEDRKSLPKDYFSKGSKILGVTNIINSKHAECSYISDNTICNKDFTITYREGKLSKKSDADPLILNVYGDGIRTDPSSGALFNNDAAWFWNTEDLTSAEDCGWTKDGDTICKITSTSEMMFCPDIGYQYNIHTLKPAKTCIGEVYDKDGPMPFIYGSQQDVPARDDIVNRAKEGKGDPDINLITGINSAFEEIEETYCASSCDLFARGPGNDDNYVLDTPIGNWRLITTEKGDKMLSPCKPTATWRIMNPSTICHGKDHLLVEDSKTHHTCSWDTTKDFIISEDVCNGNQAETDADAKALRETIAANGVVKINFWTGDKLVMKPPYKEPTWEKTDKTAVVSPGWFSKVELNRGMLHNQQDISNLMTSLVENTKQEVQYNKIEEKTIRKLLADEIFSGAAEIGASVWGLLLSLLGAIPKVVILIAAVILVLMVSQQFFTYYTKRKLIDKTANRTVSFAEEEMGELQTPINMPTAPKKRARSRSQKLSNDLSFI